MIYIIISNVGMAIMMIVVYIRYSRFRILSSAEISDLRKRLDKELEERRALEEKFGQTTKGDTEKVEKLLQEINELRKEKESEIKLRMEAEKQIELALQRTEEIQKRMQDWRLVQDAVMKDSKDAIVKVGNDLYKKLNDSYKNEVETQKNLLGKVSKHISDFFEKVSSGNIAPAAPAAKHATHAAKPASAMPATSANDPSKKLVFDLVTTMKAGGHLANKDYFLPGNFDEQKAKLMLCEMVFLEGDKLHIFDFKACRYIEEYKKDKDEAALKAKLDKYFAYLSNPKYRDSILKVMSSTKARFTKNDIIIVVPNRVELGIMKEIRYYEKARKMNFEVMDIDGVNNIVI